MASRYTDQLLREDYVNHEHMRAYARALRGGDALLAADELSGAKRISAAPDFAPIHETAQHRVQTSKPRSIDRGGVPEGFVYSLLRWPLLCVLFTLITLDFWLYVETRQLVNAIESLWTWRGRSRTLRRRLRRAHTYSEWKRAALELDAYHQHDTWKLQDASALYDWQFVRRVVGRLQVAREKGDMDALLSVLNVCLKNNFAGVENFSLYSQSFYGTKVLVEQYYAEVKQALRFLNASNAVSAHAKRTFYRVASKNYGKTALCLSGGASFGYYHVGVVKALLDADLLPTIVSGTSAGGLIAALVCTRSNEELRALLVPELADRITACEEPLRVWLPRFLRTGARFDSLQWAAKATFFTRGSLTFREAYERTGKVLNISVIPSDRHSPAHLLNYISAPDCLIWSALLASAAVPGILNPVFLMQKAPDGSVHPWSWGYTFRDGSLRVDIPLQQLHSLFNVTYPIVSQVNPHVHLFHYGQRGTPGRPTAFRRGKGWRGGFLLSATEHILKLNLKTNFKIIRDLDLMPRFMGQDWSSVFLQPFKGAATIWPKSRLLDWPQILTDPDRRELARKIASGQHVTFAMLHMIENRVRLERFIAAGRRQARAQHTSGSENGVPRPPPLAIGEADRSDAEQESVQAPESEPAERESPTSEMAYGDVSSWYAHKSADAEREDRHWERRGTMSLRGLEDTVMEENEGETNTTGDADSNSAKDVM